MDFVYGDQIWNKSQCLRFESIAYRLLRPVAKDCGAKIVLVDAILESSITDRSLIVSDNVLPNHQHQQLALWPEFYGSFCYWPTYRNTQPKSLFACFINRACPFRQSWLYQFVRRRLFDQGLISYRLDYRGDDFKKILSLKDRLDLFEEMFKRGNHIFKEEHEILKTQVPIQTFDDDLEQSIIDSKVSLVIETYFDNKNVIALSEKIFRNLVMPRPWLLFCAPGAVKHLRQVGFDVMDYIIDHSYDNIVDPVSRQVAILNILDGCRDIDIDNQLVLRMTQSCQHNYDLLKKLRKRLPKKIHTCLQFLKVYNQ